MRNIGSKLFVLLVGAAVVAGLVYSFLPQPVEVDLTKVERGTLRVTVDEDGKTRIREKYVVSAPLNGRILRINMDPGDEVIAGKTLLTMIEPRDPELLDARAVAQAEARVKAAEASLRKIEPMLEDAKASQAYAEAELTRARKAEEALTRAEIENAELLYRQHSEGLRSARIAEEIARFELQQAEAALMRSRPQPNEPQPIKPAANTTNDLEKLGDVSEGGLVEGNGIDSAAIDKSGWNFPIYSPINGRVLRVLQESAAVVTPGTPLLELGNPLDLEVEIDVLSRDAVQIHPHDLVLLEHWGGQRPLEGRVRVIEPSGFTKISTLGVEEQRVWVIVDLVDPPEKRPTLGDGFRVEARVVIDEAKDVLKIPTSSLFRVGGEPAVFKVVDGVAQQHTVQIGRQNGLEAEVTGGLAEGDQLVLHPSDRIDNGVKVRQR